MKTQSKIYNTLTKLQHKSLKHPIYLKKSLDLCPKSVETTVIFLHGISADSSTWGKTFSRLKKSKKFPHTRFLALDLLGFGDSLKADWQKYTYTEFNTAIKNSLKKYHVTTPVILVGHSMGCLISANFALSQAPIKTSKSSKTPKPLKTSKNPSIKRLILISPPVIKDTEIAKLPDKFYTKTYSSIEKIAGFSSAKALAKFIESASSFREQYLDTKAFNATMQNIILNPKNYSIFCNLATPTTIINGRLDPLVIGKNLEEISHKNPLVRLIPVMSSHDISKQKYDKLISVLERTINV